MRHYGISAIRWNSACTEVTHCWVHEISTSTDGFVASSGFELCFADVSTVIAQGDSVWVLVCNEDRTFERGDAVRTIAAPHEHLESFNANGGNHSLFDLPLF